MFYFKKANKRMPDNEYKIVFSIYLACQLKTILKLSDKCSRKRGLFKIENSVAQNSAKISM